MTQSLKRSQLLYALAILGVIALYFGWRVQLLSLHFSYDEGIHLIWGELWAAGYTPYEEIFLSYPPFFIWSMGVPWQVFQHPAALQLLMAAYALAGVLGVIYLGTVFHSRVAGLTAGLLLAFSPAYFIPSIRVMSEVPSVGIAVAAVALAEKYRRDGGRLWLGLAGAVVALSLSLKILPFYAVPFVGLLALLRHLDGESWPQVRQSLVASKTQILLDWLIAGSSFTLVFVLPFFLFDSGEAYRQVFGMRFDSRATEFNPYESASRDILLFLFGNLSLMALTLYGLVFVVVRNLKQYGLLLVWLIFVWASMNFHVPLRHKHMPIFLPLLAVFAGLAVDHIAGYLKTFKRNEFNGQTAAMVLILATLVWLFGWDLSRAYDRNNNVGEEELAKEEWLAPIEFVQAVTTPRDCVIADNPVFLYFTDRLPPPELAEASSTRITTGHLTLDDIAQAAEKHRCQAVVVVSPRFAEEVPGLTDWLAATYQELHQADGVSIYFGKIESKPDSTASPGRDGSP